MRYLTCITLLLAIIAGNLLAGLHATSHAPADLGQCELCAAYGDPSDAIPSAGLAAPVVGPEHYDLRDFKATDTGSVILGFRQRGPPLVI